MKTSFSRRQLGHLVLLLTIALIHGGCASPASECDGPCDAEPTPLDTSATQTTDAATADAATTDTSATDTATTDSVDTTLQPDSALTDAAQPVDTTTADGADSSSSWRSTLFPVDWKPVKGDTKAKGLEDYSYAGYHNGEVALPDGAKLPVITVQPKAGDNTADLQAALDEAAKKGGAVVSLGAGTFKLNGTLKITSSDTILRGAGPDKTFLRFTSHAGMAYKGHLQVGAGVKHAAPIALTTDAKAGDDEVLIASGAGLTVGQDVDVGWLISPEFIAEHGMTGVWKAFNDKWQPFFRRTVVGLTEEGGATRVKLDVPLRYPAKLRDKASLRVATGWLSEVGIEQLAITNATSWSNAWNQNQVAAIIITGVKDAWVREVESYSPPDVKDVGWMPSPHLQSGGLMVTDSKRVTIQDSKMSNAQHRGSGGNGYLFEIRASSEILTRDCEAENGRHNFIQNWGFGVSGCVWLRIVSRGGKALLGKSSSIGTLGYSEFHHSLAMSNLVDDSLIEDGWASQNRGTYSSGAGHCATRNVLWRTRGDGVLKSFNYGLGYVIGTSPELSIRTKISLITSGSKGTTPEDYVEGQGKADTLVPQSLYEAQLSKRLKTP